MKRLFKDGMVTTIIGLILLAVAVYMYLSDGFTDISAGILSGMSMVFLRSKDSLIGLAPKKPKG